MTFGSIKKISTGHYKATLKNFGTAETYPDIKLKFNSDNGWVGIVKSAIESYEIGNPKEWDTQTVKKSEVLFDYASSNGEHRIPNGLAQGLKNVGISNDINDNRPNGTLYIDNAWGRPHIALQSGQTASVTFDIPRDSNGEKGALYEYFWWRQIFWLGSASQMGYFKICVTDASGTFLYGVETFKRYNGLRCEYNFLGSNGRGGYRIIDRKYFQGTHIEQHNPFNEPRGWSDIMRFDDVVQFYWWGSYPRYSIPEIKGKKSDKIHVIFGKVGNAPLVTHMYLDDFIYRKDHVTKEEDIPNRFHMGSILEVDMSKGKTLIDNLPANDELTYLSEPFSIGTGETEIDIYTNSWIKNDPTIEISWKERFV